MASFTISSAQAPLLCLIHVSILCWGSNVFQVNVVKWTGHVKWARFLHLWSWQGWYWRFLACLIVPRPVPYEETPQPVSFYEHGQIKRLSGFAVVAACEVVVLYTFSGHINNSRHLARKYGRIFVRGHYLFREANSFPRAKLEESCELRRTDNMQG